MVSLALMFANKQRATQPFLKPSAVKNRLAAISYFSRLFMARPGGQLHQRYTVPVASWGRVSLLWRVRSGESLSSDVPPGASASEAAPIPFPTEVTQ